MRKTLLAVSAFALAASSAWAVSAFDEGSAKYKAGRYEEAAALFEKSAVQTPTAAAFYDAGSSWFRAGKKGKALASLLRARAISPRDKDIRWNLNVVRNSIPEGAPPAARNFLKERAEDVLNAVSADEAAAGMLAAFSLLLLAALLRYFEARGAGFARALSVIFIAVSAAFVTWHAFDQREPRLVVVDKSVQARYGPSAKETAAFTLKEGAETRILDETKDWYFVAASGGASGWIPRSSAEEV